MLLTLIILTAIWFFRKNKDLVFGVAFYTINILLVLQLLTFGNSVISERYTYVPYIGLLFSIAMAWSKSNWSAAIKQSMMVLFVVGGLAFSIVSSRQVHVWKDSMSLWTNALDAYPKSYIARANRGNYLITDLKAYDEGLVDYNVALQVMPDHPNSLENRAIIYLHKQMYQEALADAESFVRFHPDLPRGYFLRAFTLDRLGRPDEAITDYTKSISLDPQNDEPLANRGVIYYNSKRDYAAAKADFDAAIRLNPKKGEPFLNRARCWIKEGNKEMALRDLETARQLGTVVGEDVELAARALQ
jgi:tetratricopeptide (TPR) repeat protein